jgi:hypothetical protein
MRGSKALLVTGCGAAMLSAALMAAPASAASSRSYVVSWFHITPGMQAIEADCPKGLTDHAEKNFIRWMREAGKTPAEIEKLLEDFPNTMYGSITMRGRIDGKPANAYTNPTSVPDPNMYSVQGRVGLGFNLDGKNTPEDFSDPVFGETGVDNNMFRALGCVTGERGQAHGLTVVTRPGYPGIQWDHNRVHMAAWLLEVTGIDDPKNDPDVAVGLYQATLPLTKDANGEPQSDMTFQVDGNPKTTHKMRGAIVNGVLTTDSFHLYLILAKYGIIPTIELDQAKIRLALSDDGTAKGIVGGYQNWLDLYGGFGRGGSGIEVNISFDVPGIYYNLRKFADAKPDPRTGQNTMISAAYYLDLVPAFILHPTTTAAAVK